MKGLYRELEAVKSLHTRAVDFLANPESEPVDYHLAETHRDQHAREIVELKDAIAAEETLIADLEVMIAALDKAKLKTPHRQLALRHLEDAQSRLLRDLGTKTIAAGDTRVPTP